MALGPRQYRSVSLPPRPCSSWVSGNPSGLSPGGTSAWKPASQHGSWCNLMGRSGPHSSRARWEHLPQDACNASKHCLLLLVVPSLCKVPQVLQGNVHPGPCSNHSCSWLPLPWPDPGMGQQMQSHPSSQMRRGSDTTPPSAEGPSSHLVQPLGWGCQCLQGGPQNCSCSHSAPPQPAARSSEDCPRSAPREPPSRTPSTLSLLSQPSHMGTMWEAVEKS